MRRGSGENEPHADGRLHSGQSGCALRIGCTRWVCGSLRWCICIAVPLRNPLCTVHCALCSVRRCVFVRTGLSESPLADRRTALPFCDTQPTEAEQLQTGIATHREEGRDRTRGATAVHRVSQMHRGAQSRDPRMSRRQSTALLRAVSAE